MKTLFQRSGHPGLLPWIGGTVWLGLLCFLSGPEVALSVLTVTLFCLPGFALLGFVNPVTRPLEAAIHAATGIAVSLLATLIYGCLCGKLSTSSQLIVLFTTSTIANFLSRGQPHTEVPADDAPAPVWLIIIIATLVLSVPLSGAAPFSEVTPSYRPFFNADYFKHLAIAQALVHGTVPPVDPFGAIRGTLGYYWLQHLLPGAALRWFHAADPLRLMVSIGQIQTALLLALMFGLALRCCGNVRAAAFATVIGFAGLSLDGIAAVLQAPETSALQRFSEYNVEALDLSTSLGAMGHIAATTLFRLCLYLPQHQLCAVFFGAALSLEFMERSVAREYALATLIMAMPATSLLLGMPAVATLLLIRLWKLYKRQRAMLLALLSFPVAIALPIVTGMLDFDFARRLSTEPGIHSSLAARLANLAWMPLQLLSSFGFVFIAICVAPSAPWAKNLLRVELLAPLAVGLGGYFFAEAVLAPGRVQLDGELKLSILLALVMVPFSSGWILSMLRGRAPRWQRLLGLGVLVFGVITPVHDMFWHSHLAIPRDLPGQTVTIPQPDMEAMRWIRENLPEDSIIQQFPEAAFLSGGRDTWIPVFAGRNVAVSQRASNATEVDQDLVQRIFKPATEGAGVAIAKELGIGYLYLSRSLQRRDYNLVRDAWGQVALLSCIFDNGDVSIWKLVVPTTQRETGEQ